MIGSHRTGATAGNFAAQQHPGLSLAEQKEAAEEEFKRRKQTNIAHIFPEAIFIEGFLEGYHSPVALLDGLIMASKQSNQI